MNIYNIIQGHIQQLLAIYVKENKLGLVLGQKAMVHLARNSYEPDICFWSWEKSAQF